MATIYCIISVLNHKGSLTQMAVLHRINLEAKECIRDMGFT